MLTQLSLRNKVLRMACFTASTIIQANGSIVRFMLLIHTISRISRLPHIQAVGGIQDQEVISIQDVNDGMGTLADNTGCDHLANG